MKKIIILLGLIASFTGLVACSSKTAFEQSSVPAMETASAHPDFKGEVSRTK